MGAQIISSVLLAATSYDVIDLATVKDELKVTDTTTDAWFARAITQTSTDISQYCNRVFQVETVRDMIFPDRDYYPFQVPGGLSPLQVSRWPLLPAAVTLVTSADTPSGISLPFASTTGLTAGLPVLWAGLASAGVVQSVAAAAVQLAAPVPADVPAGTPVTFGLNVTVADGSSTFPTQMVVNQDFLIDARKGQLIRLNRWTGYPMPWDPVATTVTYQSGYSVIPPDVVKAALQLITEQFHERGQNPALKSREQPSLGTETFWVGTRPGADGVFSTAISGRLDNYRVPVVA